MLLMKTNFRPGGLPFCLVVVCLFACQGQNEAGRKTQLALESQLTAAEQLELVARVGDRRITLRDLERRLNEQVPLLRSQFGNSQRKISFLIEWVRLHVLANEALKLGLESTPHVREQTDSALVRALLVELGKQSLRANPVVSPSEITVPEGSDANERVLDDLRVRQQRLLMEKKEEAVLTVLSEYDAQRQVTYRQDEWTKFKADHKRSKDGPK